MKSAEKNIGADVNHGSDDTGVFFIIYPALFSTAFTGIKLIVEQITQRASLQWNSLYRHLWYYWSLPLCLDDFSVDLPVHLNR